MKWRRVKPHRVVVAVRGTQLADIEYGVWCWTCTLPSAGSVPMALEYANEEPYTIVTVTHCPTCGWTDLT